MMVSYNIWCEVLKKKIEIKRQCENNDRTNKVVKYSGLHYIFLPTMYKYMLITIITVDIGPPSFNYRRF